MKMFWFLLLAGIALFVGSSIYNFKECTAFQTDWYACTIPKCRISRFVEDFSLGILMATLSLWLTIIFGSVKDGLPESSGQNHRRVF
jgi:hypothetical protein